MNLRAKCFIAAFIALWVAWGNAFAQGMGALTGSSDRFLTAEEAYRADIAVADDVITVTWHIEPGYYLYRGQFAFEQVGDAGNRTIPAEYEEGLRKFDEYFQKEVETYYDQTRIRLSTAELPESFTLKMRSQGCADEGLCYAPRTQYFDINRKFLTAVEAQAPAAPGGAAASDGGSASSASASIADTSFKVLLVYWLLAAGGGLILNLMPCVFPVLSLKALSFTASSGSKHSHHLHGWAYTAGVVGSFVLAASLILVTRAAGESAGWGFQLQSPAFVAFLVYLFLIMGLSLSGMIYLGGGMMGAGQGLTASSGLRGSFFTGVLAAVVASPCTGPLMAPALGFALTQSAPVSLSVFIVLGLGMASPFLLLSYSPRLARILPKPGAWMVKLKELLAFPMYLTAAWLLFVFGRQVGMSGVFFLCLGAIALVWAIWLLQNLPQRALLRRLQQATALAAVLFAGYVVYSGNDFREQDDAWQAFSEQRLADLRADNRLVFVDFTADWCITCKTNEVVALSRSGFREAVERYDVALLKADWTDEDPEISRVLESFDRSGVPLYLVYPPNPDAPPQVLPQLLTQDLVIDALKRAASEDKIVNK